MAKNIIVTGSLAYDRIMNFPGYFSDHILPEKIHLLNVSFQVDGVKEKFGGSAGNIAYALNLLGERPLISATIGRDYQRYFEWFQSLGISTADIKVIDDELTASAYITTDKADNQITGFNPGAMKYSSLLDLSKFDPSETLLIISPGNREDMLAYSSLCRTLGVDYIFDPGQQLTALDPHSLLQSINGCRILISNDYELEMIKQKTGLSQKELQKLAGTIIVTCGERGSWVYSSEMEIQIPSAKPRQVLDPTGAGDAYRGGLISGLVHNLNVKQCAVMGSACASFCVECYGTQEYSFSRQEFEDRVNECYACKNPSA